MDNKLGKTEKAGTDNPNGDPSEDMPKAGENVKGEHNVFEVSKLLGKGTFGAVYLVALRTHGKTYAMKCEHVKVKKQVLKMECTVLSTANKNKSPHFCEVIDRGHVKGRFMFVVMTLLGKNLWDLRKERNPQKFTINTALKASEQCLQSIRDLHRAGYLHRDVKPPNFAIGMEPYDHTIFIIDFGLCRAFKSVDKDIRQPRAQAPFRGTARYASRSSHHNEEQCMKDDLEGWFYMTVEFTNGKLPWRHFKGTDRDKMLKIKDEVRTPEKLQTFLAECPFTAYQRIMLYIDELLYTSIPDYDYLWYLLLIAKKENGCMTDAPLDWDTEKAYKGPQYIPDRNDIMDKIEKVKEKKIKEKKEKKSNSEEKPEVDIQAEHEESKRERKRSTGGTSSKDSRERSQDDFVSQRLYERKH